MKIQKQEIKKEKIEGYIDEKRNVFVLTKGKLEKPIFRNNEFNKEENIDLTKVKEYLKEFRPKFD